MQSFVTAVKPFFHTQAGEQVAVLSSFFRTPNTAALCANNFSRPRSPSHRLCTTRKLFFFLF